MLVSNQMSQLKNEIEKKYIQAVKNQEALLVSVFRLIRAAVKNKEIEIRPTLVSDKDVLDVIKKMVKQNHESIEQFQKGGRADLVEKAKKELSILQTLLPKQLGSNELKTKIQAIVTKLGTPSLKEMGKVMQEVSSALGAEADMKEASSIVKSLLQKG